MKSVQKIADSRHMQSLENSKSGMTKKFLEVSYSSGGLNKVADKAIQAGIVGNFNKIVDSDVAQNFMKTSNYGPYVNELWPVITAWYPEFPLKDLISVQDMDQALAYMFISRLKAGTTKGNTIAGDVLETPMGLRRLHGSYPTGEVIGEVIPVATQSDFDTDHITMATAYSPIITKNTASIAAFDKILVKCNKSGSTVATYVAASIAGSVVTLGTKSGSTITPVAGATLDIQIGALVVPSAAADTYDEIVVNYVWDIETSTVDNIPSVVEDIEMIPIEAQPRALNMSWTLFSEYIKKSQFGTDVREENTKRVLNLLYSYQTRYILDNMYDYAEGDGNAHTITANVSTAHDLQVVSSGVQRQLKQLGTVIEVNSGRMEGNKIVCGSAFKNWLESLPDNLYKPVTEENAFSGPRPIGQYGSFQVFYDPDRAANENMMTYRGPEWYDAVYYMGSFMPIVATDIITLGIRSNEAFASMEAYFYHKPNCVVNFTFAVA